MVKDRKMEFVLKSEESRSFLSTIGTLKDNTFLLGLYALRSQDEPTEVGTRINLAR